MAKGFRTTIKTLCNEVSGSCHEFKVKRPGTTFERFIVDFGAILEKRYEKLNSLMNVKASELSFAIVTHSHIDHIMRLPMLVSNGFHRPIYCTPASKESISICLRDSLQIMQSEYDKYGKEMLYTEKEVEEVEKLLVGIEYNLPTHVTKGVKVTFLRNGHLYGSASVLLEISCSKYNNKNILITSDYYPSNDLFEVTEIPNWVLNLKDLTIIQESTYGDVHVDNVNFNLTASIISAINIGNNILFPVIAQERLELVLLRLKQLQDGNFLSEDIKIFIHSELGKQYLENVYLKSKNIVDFMPKNVEIVAKGDYDTVISYEKQKIILSSSGTAEQGSVRYYLKQYLEDSNFTVIFTCYTPKDSLGYKLRHSHKGSQITIDDETLSLYCNIKHTNELSKHTKYEDIVEYIEQFSDVKNVLLTHGETKIKNILLTELSEDFKDINFFIMNRKTGFKIDSENAISTYPSRFKNEDENFLNASIKDNKSRTVKKPANHK